MVSEQVTNKKPPMEVSQIHTPELLIEMISNLIDLYKSKTNQCQKTYQPKNFDGRIPHPNRNHIKFAQPLLPENKKKTYATALVDGREAVATAAAGEAAAVAEVGSSSATAAAAKEAAAANDSDLLSVSGAFTEAEPEALHILSVSEAATEAEPAALAVGEQQAAVTGADRGRAAAATPCSSWKASSRPSAYFPPQEPSRRQLHALLGKLLPGLRLLLRRSLLGRGSLLRWLLQNRRLPTIFRRGSLLGGNSTLMEEQQRRLHALLGKLLPGLRFLLRWSLLGRGSLLRRLLQNRRLGMWGRLRLGMWGGGKLNPTIFQNTPQSSQIWKLNPIPKIILKLPLPVLNISKRTHENLKTLFFTPTYHVRILLKP